MTASFTTSVDWTAVDAVIFDVDGTLFDNTRVRRHLQVRLLRHLLTRRSGWRDVRTVLRFRRTRERLALAEVDDIGRRQYADVASDLGLSANEIKAIVSRWIYQEALAFVPRYAMHGAERFIVQLRELGIRTGVFSDNPAAGKLTALGIKADIVRDASAADIGRLKPHPGGFIRVAQLLEVAPHRCLIIGDRDDRDGAAARRGGFMFLKKVSKNPRSFEFSCYDELIGELERQG